MNDQHTLGSLPCILLVDDTPINLQVLSGMLKAWGYRTCAVSSGKLALEAVQNNPPDLILLDVNMPEMNGFEVCVRLKSDERLKDIPVIFLSALGETQDKLSAFSVGGVDYITKPFQAEEIRARVETHLKLRHLQIKLESYNHHLEELVQNQVGEIYSSRMATIFALAKLAEFRDDDTGKHTDRVQAYCHLLISDMGRRGLYHDKITDEYVENLSHANPLHDIGKVGIPDRILLKPAKLTDKEFDTMKTHTTLGAGTLEVVQQKYPQNSFIQVGIEIARSHHERWDGSGYPQGLAGENIPLSARITAIADVYDALRSKRPYKPAFTHEESLAIIEKSAGSHFDPSLVESFLKQSKEFVRIANEMEG
ncbi:MAG: response regulator [Myxococcales bacterium]|nr:MAG: response regulator [Myxococcales bacterium]